MPTLRALRETGGFLTTDELRSLVQRQFVEPLGQWNIISNMDGRHSLIFRGLVSRQVRYAGGDWYDFNEHLPKEGPRPEQRLAITEKGRLLLGGVSEAESLVPENFEQIISEQIAVVQERARDLSELVPQRDEADRDATPGETSIRVEPPRPPQAGDHLYDPEARRQATARRVAGHHTLLVALTAKARHSGLAATQTRYADALIRSEGFGAIFEIKTVKRGSRTDLIHQLRAAIAQLYHYRFIHRTLHGFEHNVKLYAVFDVPVPEDLSSFLSEINISAIWFTNDTFHGDAAARSQLPWLF